MFINDKDLFTNENLICTEYPAETQMSIMGITMEELKEPVLDLGCGSGQLLMKYLTAQGLDVTGLDDEVEPDEKILKTDWFKYEFKSNYWGTIISHMAFSQRFIHNHINKNGKPAIFAYFFRRILDALKIGGSFIYTPGLPFIEQYLNPDTYTLSTSPIRSDETLFKKIAEQMEKIFGQDIFYTTRIKRLKYYSDLQ
jgi:hypothetical protein